MTELHELTTHTMLDSGELVTHDEWAARCQARYAASHQARIDRQAAALLEQAADYDYRGDIADDWRFAGWVSAAMVALAGLVAITPA